MVKIFSKPIIILTLIIIISGLFWSWLGEKEKAEWEKQKAEWREDRAQGELNSNNIDYRKIYSNDNLDINFSNLVGWNVISETDNEVVLENTSGVNKGDKITISLVKDNIITDTDNKFGSVTYYYDQLNGRWIEKGGVSEMTGESSLDKPAVAQTYTADGEPVFLGTRRWLTYILPISPNSILKLNITGSGETKPLEDLVKTLKKS